MARKKQKLYTADELREIKSRLIAHTESLRVEILDIAASLPAFDEACVLRDKAQNLVSTYGALKHIDNTIYHADHVGPCDLTIDAERCGFEVDATPAR